jgi:phage terminase small subunit
VPTLNNPRHDKFCLELMEGCSNAEAARRAGFSVNYSRVYAHSLIKRPTIEARLKELRELATTDKVASVLERKIKLTDVIRNDKAPIKVRIYAIAELNKMEGAYAPTKVETQNQTVAIKEIIYHMGEDDGSNPIALPPG